MEKKKEESVEKEELTLQNVPKAVNYLINEIAEMRAVLEHIESQLGLGVDKHRPIDEERAAEILGQTKKGIDIMGMEQNLTAELDAICQNNLTDALLDLAKIVEGIRKELGFEQEADKCSLNGSLVPFILGITATQPDSTTYVPGIFTEQQPLQVTIAFDNNIRNQAVNWMKANGYEISSYLGQPLLKLKNVRIIIRRVVKS